MSKRGDIVVDARTNTLIIREIPTYLPAVLQLIDNLDTATPQVMIESRIVETTKTPRPQPRHQLEVPAASADVAHGNTTNLIFPNTIAGGLNVGLGNGPTVASLRARQHPQHLQPRRRPDGGREPGPPEDHLVAEGRRADQHGGARSSRASRSPSRRTSTTRRRSSTSTRRCKLDVTPQITDEGTILLTVNVTKREPAVALNLALGQNVPLTIREYRGQVLVTRRRHDGHRRHLPDQRPGPEQHDPGPLEDPDPRQPLPNKTRTEKHDELLIFITPRILRS